VTVLESGGRTSSSMTAILHLVGGYLPIRDVAAARIAVERQYWSEFLPVIYQSVRIVIYALQRHATPVVRGISV